MQPALLIRLRPVGPWRFGPADGAHDRLDTLFRSDRLFSAVTLAMQRLGLLEEWLQATARNPEPVIAFSSLFPFQGDTLFITPPVTLWPPPAGQVVAPNPVFLAKIRWSSVSFVPLTVVDALLTGGQTLAEQWLPDSESACLLRRDRPSSSPFRVTMRRSAAVDRPSRTAGSTASAACIEFEPGAGLWAIARYRDTTVEAAWREPLEAAFRLLSDSGFGGKRTSGWGQTAAPEFQRGVWPGIILPRVERLHRSQGSPDLGEQQRYWVLSLYSPAEGDRIDWTTGDYRITVRTGRVESNGASGALKKSARMVEEGSVLAGYAEPVGSAVDVAPAGFHHPVYRSGVVLALALPRIPSGAAFDEARAVEEPASQEESLERVCEPTPVAALEEIPDIQEGDREGDGGSDEEQARPEQQMPEQPAFESLSEAPQTIEAEFPGEIQPAPETESEPPAPVEEPPPDGVAEEPAPEPDHHAEQEHENDAL